MKIKQMNVLIKIKRNKESLNNLMIRKLKKRLHLKKRNTQNNKAIKIAK
jgi:hypothetical protein